MTHPYVRLLDQVTRVGGVRGAMLVVADDGLVVAESLMEGIRGGAVAALAASLTRRLAMVTKTSAVGELGFLQLQAEEGTLAIVPAPAGVLVVAVGGSDMNVGLARLEMLRVAEVVR